MNVMERTKIRVRSWTKYFMNTLIYALAGCVIGVLVGLFEVLFGWGLNLITKARVGYENWLLLLLPVMGVIIVYLFERYGKVSRKGMGLVFEISQGRGRPIPKRTVSLMMISTWLSHVAGASVGKEGVGMQIGATVSHVIGRNVPYFKENKTVFLVTGMAAGFAGLFGTPFTAIFFALEVLVYGMIEFKALAPALAAAFSASWVSSLFGLGKEVLHFSLAMPEDWMSMFLPLIALGIAFGVMGGFFAWSMHHFKGLVNRKITNPYVRVIAGSIVLGLILWAFNCRYSGSGINLIEAGIEGGKVYPWDFAMKLALTVLSMSIGFIGGEVTPLFAIGSTFGVLIAPLVGMDPMMCAALGYAAVFGAGTNTWLAPMMIGMEMFGFEYFPLFFIVCATANLVNGNLSIYRLQGLADMPD